MVVFEGVGMTKGKRKIVFIKKVFSSFFRPKKEDWIDRIVQDIDENGDLWKEDRFVFFRTNGGFDESRYVKDLLGFWVCNGISFLELYEPKDAELNLYEKKRLWKSYKKWRKRKKKVNKTPIDLDQYIPPSQIKELERMWNLNKEI